VTEVLKRLPLVHVEMQAGDALFFHANLLHRSDQNTSEHPRWSMICCYDDKSNAPYKPSHQPRYTPLNKVPDAVITEASLKQFGEGDVSWLEVSIDRSASVLART
jgi:ectoine hydroxylase